MKGRAKLQGTSSRFYLRRQSGFDKVYDAPSLDFRLRGDFGETHQQGWKGLKDLAALF